MMVSIIFYFIPYKMILSSIYCTTKRLNHNLKEIINCMSFLYSPQHNRISKLLLHSVLCIQYDLRPGQQSRRNHICRNFANIFLGICIAHSRHINDNVKFITISKSFVFSIEMDQRLHFSSLMP